MTACHSQKQKILVFKKNVSIHHAKAFYFVIICRYLLKNQDSQRKRLFRGM